MRSLLKFFALTFIVSWVAWIAAAAIMRIAAPPPSGVLALNGLLYVVGVFAPALAALALTARAEGRAGVLAMLRRTLHGAVGVLLLTMLMHAAINNTKDIVPSAVSGAAHAFSLGSSRVGWVSVAILWICAAYFPVRMRGVTMLEEGVAD